MLTTFTLLTAVGSGLRLGCAWLLQHRLGLGLTVPPPLALILVALAGLPGWLSPIAFPLPLSMTLGFLLPDLLLRRWSS